MKFAFILLIILYSADSHHTFPAYSASYGMVIFSFVKQPKEMQSICSVSHFADAAVEGMVIVGNFGQQIIYYFPRE